jgi:hypothetical protein
MSLFSVIDDAQAIIRSKAGVYKQVKLYERDNVIYAATGGGYVRLLRDNRTSNPNIKWEHIDNAQYSPTLGACTSLRYLGREQTRRAA